MQNTLKLLSIIKRDTRIEIDYEIRGDWQRYFALPGKMWVEYSCNIEKVPDSIAVIPLIGNILPIAWLCNAEIIVEALDQDFYENLNSVKKGYEDMYPMFDFAGKLTVSEIVSHKSNTKENRAASFFSGGADAYTTLLRHIDENPILLAVWGADIKPENTDGWKKVENHIQSVLKEYALDWICIKSSFRTFIKERELNLLVEKSGDGWWHGFQHGMGLISHVAPIAYLYGLKRTYIASSFTSKLKGRYTCASDPTIDDHVAYCGCKTIHDGYEIDRQEKIRYLVSKKKEGNSVNLRVCWESTGGGNCCRCEKCYRTILEIVSECGNPNEFGFVWDDTDIKRCEKDLKYKMRIPQSRWNHFYIPMQKMLEMNAKDIPDIKKYQWIQRIDFFRINNTLIKVLRYSSLGRGMKKALRILKVRNL